MPASKEVLESIKATLLEGSWATQAEIAAMSDADLVECAEALHLEIQATTAIAQPRLSDVEIEIQHGAAMFKFPGSDTTVESFAGVILAVRKQMAWYEKNYVQGSKDAPDCSSADGVTGSKAREVRKIGGVERECFGQCGTCFYGQFESSRQGTNAKDCAESRVIVVKVPDLELPLLLRAPSKSIQSINSYLVNIANQKLPMSWVRTKFSLYHEQGADNYSILGLTLDGKKEEARLPIAEARRMSAMKSEAPYLALTSMKALPDGEGGAQEVEQSAPAPNGKTAAPVAAKATQQAEAAQQDDIPF